MPWITWVPAFVIAAVAVATDVSARRIPNWLTMPAAAAALVVHGAVLGWPGAWHALGGLVLGLAMFLPFFLLGGMGAGDVKLLAALGAWLGPADVVWVALYAAIAGGVLAVFVALGAGYFRQMWRNLWLLLTHWRVSGLTRVDSVTLEHGRGPRLAYALPIGAGLLMAMWLR